MSERMESVKESLRVFSDFLKTYGFVFLPSITLILGGLATFVRPDLLTPVIATFFVTLGGSLAYITWKLVLLKERAQGIMEKFDGKILVHGVRMQGMEETEIIDPNDDPGSQMMH